MCKLRGASDVSYKRAETWPEGPAERIGREDTNYAIHFYVDEVKAVNIN